MITEIPPMASPIPASSPPQVEDRRHHVRYAGQYLVVEIEGTAYPVTDISVGGVRFEDIGRKIGEMQRAVIRSTSEGGASIGAEITIVTIDGKRIHASFSKPSMPLMRYIVSHLSEVHGIEPHLIK
ncbi:conserved hypothetical protein [Candidatus Terasakiella magnetica]|nr:conserved hypothetical protein [Candidatus Terasakiella magnetica]